MATLRAAKAARRKPEGQREKLLGLLADGEFYSGEHLARQLRVTRSAVWKLIGKLRLQGIAIEATSRRGYRLSQPVELYDTDTIRSALGDQTRLRTSRIDALLAVDSTNSFLLDAPAPAIGQASVCMTEVQTAGRGRRGRSWLAPFGSGICMSLSWQFAETPPTFSALSLAIGLALVRAVRRFGSSVVQLKWPNDLVWMQRKLAGILIEIRGEADGPAHVVIGIGLNLRLPSSTRLKLAEQQAALVTDLHEVLGDRAPGRNVLVAAIVDEIVMTLLRFEHEGFAPFADEWRKADALRNVAVRVLSGNEAINGIARGVASDGALAVEVNGKIQLFTSGDVSLRALNR